MRSEVPRPMRTVPFAALNGIGVAVGMAVLLVTGHIWLGTIIGAALSILLIEGWRRRSARRADERTADEPPPGSATR